MNIFLPHGARRNGIVLVAVLVCLIVASAVFGMATKLAVARHLAARHRQIELQAQFLTESGIERAAARLAVRPEYRGETWRIPAAELDGSHDAVVEIQVEPVADNPQLGRITVRTHYPAQAEPRAGDSKQVLMSLLERGEEP